MIKHVSFDVWNTLITPNPAYAEARTKFLALALNMDPAHVKLCYTKIKAIADGDAEKNGIAFKTDELFQLLYRSIGVFVSPGLHREIRATTEQLFKSCPPVLGEGVRELMDWLHERGITTSIGSNSNFISGTVMRPFLEEQLGRPFLTAVFSDLIGSAKPHPEFFDAVAFKVNVFRDPPIDRNEILHVGDSTICDITGAQRAGIHSLLIKTPAILRDQVKLRIECENDFDVSFAHHLNQ